MSSMRHLFQSCALFLLLLVPSLALAQQHLLVAEDATSAIAFQSQIGRVGTFICPSTLSLNREICYQCALSALSSDPKAGSGWQPLSPKAINASLQVSPSPLPITGTFPW